MGRELFRDCRKVTATYSLQQFALHEGLDHVVGGGEVPGLVDEVDRFETGREGVLVGSKQGF